MKLWLAQGFGIGRIPIAPGTFGSVAGLVLFALLLAPGKPWFYFMGSGAAIALSIWLCGFAEDHLRQKDPQSVVLDEIVAIPVCFYAWVTILVVRTKELPDISYFLSGPHLLLTAAVFAAFRFFDIVKPWPVGRSQELPRGWGITIDDVLAALYVTLALLVAAQLGLHL